MKIGFLPLYLALYDKVSPDTRPRVQAFADQTAQDLRHLGFEVVQSPICRVKEEFRNAVETFRKENV